MWGLSGLHTDEALTQHLVLPRARSCWHTMRRRDQPPSGDVRSGPPVPWTALFAGFAPDGAL